MALKKLKYGSNTFALAVTVFAILLVINYLSSRRFVRADLTESKLYTISDSTKKILTQLDDIVKIDLYFSKKPEEIKQIRENVKDFLDEYQAYAKGNLNIDFIDPAEDDQLKQQLRFKGIPEAQINYRSRDEIKIANVFMGISVQYGDKSEVLPIVQNTLNLEYDLTSAILKVTRKETKVLGFLSGHDELDIDQPAFQAIKAELKKQYDVRKIDLKEGKQIDNDVSTLVIAGPKLAISDAGKYEIDQFVMRGGRVVFLIDPITLQPQGLQAAPNTHALGDLLSHYGAKLGNNLVQDQSNESATFQQGFMSVTQPYPFFVRVQKKDLSAETPITAQLNTLVLPWTSSLTIETTSDQITSTVLAKSSEFAWTSQSPYNLYPNRSLKPPASVTDRQTLAVLLSGVFKSHFDGKAKPESISADRELKTESPPTQIVIVGTSQFLAQGRKDGLVFFQNAVDSLTLGDELIGIRSQKIIDRPLRETKENERLFLKIMVIAGMPIIVAIFGISRYYLRRRAKQMIEAYGKM